MAEDINITLQKLANNSAKSIQDSVNKANMEGLKFNAAEAEKARKFNAQEAATARAWQEIMSKTSHQMEVADLKKAGLNPVLSANSGAQSYSTSSASANAASGSVDSGANAFSSIMGSLMSTMAGLKQSEMSSAAQKYSADKNYKAAKIGAAAQKYSANMSAAAQKYSADQATYREMIKPQNGLLALVDKYFGDSISSATGASKKTVSSVLGNITSSLPKSAYGYSKTGVAYVKDEKKFYKSLRVLGIEPKDLSKKERYNATYRYLELVTDDRSDVQKNALKYLQKLANKNPKKAKTIASTSPFKGNNWNPYKND